MPGALLIRNQQRTKTINGSYLLCICRAVLQDFLKLENFDLVIRLVAAPKMRRLNEKFLRHAGPTDVITFDYADKAGQASRLPVSAAGPSEGRRDARPALCGEIFICIDEAIVQACRFRTNWQSELTRYAIHGILHLIGHGDQTPAGRRRMKRREDGLLRAVSHRFPLSKLAPSPRLAA